MKDILKSPIRFLFQGWSIRKELLQIVEQHENLKECSAKADIELKYLREQLDKRHQAHEKTHAHVRKLLGFIAASRRIDEPPTPGSIREILTKVNLALFLFLPLLAFGQPVQRQFFTTNTDPRVTVVAGTNAFITASTPLPNVRQFLIDVPSIGGSGQTNLALVVAGTNATVVASTNLGVTTFTVSSTASGSGQTNLTLIVAGTNVFVTSATNLGVTTFTIDGPALRTTWSVGDITNAGTLAYSNVAVLIGATNTATLQTQLGLGTAAYSNTTAFLLKSGDTSTGPQLTSSASASGPAPNEFVTGGWVRGLFANAGQLFYTTTNIYPIGTNVGSAQPEYEYSTNIPLPAVRSYSTAAGDFLTNNGYIGSVIVTNAFQQLGGQITVSAYLGYTGGGGSPTLTLHPEIYYSYDRTNWLGDYTAADQNIPTGQTNLRQWVIDFPAHFSTNATGFWIQRRFKVGAVTGTGTRTLWVLVGTNAISGTSDAAHIAVPLPSGGGIVYASNVVSGGTIPLAAVPTATNYWSGPQTYSTNGLDLNVDFSTGNYVYTNAANNVTLSGYRNYDVDRVNWKVISLSNSSASSITFTWPSGTRVYGTNSGTSLSILSTKVCRASVWIDPFGTNLQAICDN